MKKTIGAALAAALVAGSAAQADLVLHMDINSIRAQAANPGGANSSFGGLSHTGSVNFSFQSNVSILAAIDIQDGNNTPQNQTLTGGLVNFTGQVTMANGMVTGGNLQVTVSGGSGATYSAQITPGVGSVTNYVGGGFKIEGLTFNGRFSGSNFAGVDVTPWFSTQNFPGGLPGSFLQFNFTPNAQGFSYADMDLWVSVIPLPPAAWTGLATLAGVMVTGYLRRRRR